MAAVVKVEQTVQEWGNGLGVRITAAVAKAAKFARGLPVTESGGRRDPGAPGIGQAEADARAEAQGVRSGDSRRREDG